MGASTILQETHYIDRHFIEEVGSYYSRCLDAPVNFCQRFHLFSDSISQQGLEKILGEAASHGADAARKQLQRAYLGFVVVRPLPSVPIGRTVLQCLATDADRCFPTTIEYQVYLLGIPLTVGGLGFQQQDRAVAACATTAVWSSLQRMFRHEGDRAPTPSEISEAAVRSLILGRPLPSPGLTPQQISESLRSVGFPPEVFGVAGDPESFKFMLHAYVSSGVPVILAIQNEQGLGHAVTVVGYRNALALAPVKKFGTRYAQVLNLGFETIYLHDDRLGPYARAMFKQNGQELKLEIAAPGMTENSEVILATAPLYPKLRCNARELYGCAADLLPLVSTLHPAGQLGFQVSFIRSGEYLNSLYGRGLAADRLARFQRNISLSRYVGLVSWFLDGDLLLDTVWDTTDTVRDQVASHLLGVVGHQAVSRDSADQLALVLGAVPG